MKQKMLWTNRLKLSLSLHRKNQTAVESEPENNENLDPPRGMGLKFDEIEKMIDEVLAFES